MRRLLGVVAVFCFCAACPWAAESPAQSKPGGTVQVLYAGSLGAVLEKSLGPEFERSSGFTYQGEGQGSLGAAKMISDGLRSPDVFISADAAVNDKVLMTPAKKLTDWYGTFASSAMVLGYNPNSKFKPTFEQVQAGKLPWYEALKTPGLKLGRTDPNLDPKGYRTIFLFHLAESYYHRNDLTSLLGDPANPAQIFPESELLIRMESGQLDAGFFYRHEVVAHRVPFVELPNQINQSDPSLAYLYKEQKFTTDKGVTITATPILFTITIPRTAKNVPGAVAFVRFVLAGKGRDLIEQYGLRPAAILVNGDQSKVPSDIQPLVKGTFAP
jgi:molybdate/tungstate transport system substrate-binding protein